MDPDQAWTHGVMWALSLKLKDKLENQILGGGGGGGGGRADFCWKKKT